MNIWPEGYYVLGAIGIVLALASLIGFALQRRGNNTTVQNLNIRIKAWWVMVVLLGGTFMAGRNAVITLFALLSFAALREFITLTPTRRADYAALAMSFFVVLPAQYYLIWTEWYGFFSIFIPVYSFLILPILAVLRADVKDFLARTSETQWGLMISVYCVSHVPALLTLKIPGFENREALLIVFLLVVVQASDVLQYVFGKLFGRHKIAPSLSPSKTLEGFLGGAVSAIAVGASLWRLTPFSPAQAAAMALMIVLMGFLGGLVMSAIKRDRGVKDWGHLIEGHGGVLDRLDSVCFSAPIFFHLTRYFFVP